MDGTLLDLHFDNYFWCEFLPRHYAEVNQMDLTQVHQEVFSRYHQHRGTLKWYCVDHWSQQLNLNLAELKQQHQDRIRWRPHAEAFLQWLQPQCPLYLVTNAHRSSLDIKCAMTGLDQYFTHVISSHDFQAPKESLAFWQALQTQYSFDPATSLFIDDNCDILTTAQRFGLGHLYSIDQPDSQVAPRQRLPFPTLDFSQYV